MFKHRKYINTWIESSMYYLDVYIDLLLLEKVQQRTLKVRACLRMRTHDKVLTVLKLFPAYQATLLCNFNSLRACDF